MMTQQGSKHVAIMTDVNNLCYYFHPNCYIDGYKYSVFNSFTSVIQYYFHRCVSAYYADCVRTYSLFNLVSSLSFNFYFFSVKLPQSNNEIGLRRFIPIFSNLEQHVRRPRPFGFQDYTSRYDFPHYSLILCFKRERHKKKPECRRLELA